MGNRALGRCAMHRHDDAGGEPYADVRGEVERLVGDADVNRLVGGEPGA